MHVGFFFFFFYYYYRYIYALRTGPVRKLTKIRPRLIELKYHGKKRTRLNIIANYAAYKCKIMTIINTKK
jgi:hypothetical protein